MGMERDAEKERRTERRERQGKKMRHSQTGREWRKRGKA